MSMKSSQAEKSYEVCLHLVYSFYSLTLVQDLLQEVTDPKKNLGAQIESLMGHRKV